MVDWGRVGRLLGAAGITIVCAMLGLVLGALHSTFATAIVERPAAHRVAPRADATPLSMAMIYDTVHGLHPQHGMGWQRAVEARARAVVEAAPGSGPATEAVLDAHDDLAVALDRLGRPDEGLAVLARKYTHLERTWPEPPPSPDDAADTLSPDRRAWYRTYANRGTLRIHRAFPKLMAAPDDDAIRADVRAGLADIRRSIALNPAAHFGRERWQAWIVAALLAALEDPEMPLDYDLIGLRHDSGPLEPIGGHPSLLPDDGDIAALDPERRAEIRMRIPHYQPDPDWAEAVGHPGHPIPFDEPALAIVGMWLYGGGANPHFATLLGRLMQRIDQPVIAWAAYARAAELSPRFGPLRGLYQPMVEDASTRLAAELGQTADELQAAFDAERARGRAYREAQTAFEAALPDPLAEGALAPFIAERGDIRTAPGQADRTFIKTSGGSGALILAWVLWFAALGAWLAGGRLRAHPRAPKS